MLARLAMEFWSLAFIATSLLNMITCQTVEQRFLSVKPETGTENATASMEVHTRSKLECASFCTREEFCCYFTYDKNTRSCQMSTSEMTHPGYQRIMSNLESSTLSTPITTSPTTLETTDPTTATSSETTTTSSTEPSATSIATTTTATPASSWSTILTTTSWSTTTTTSSTTATTLLTPSTTKSAETQTAGATTTSLESPTTTGLTTTSTTDTSLATTSSAEQSTMAMTTTTSVASTASFTPGTTSSAEITDTTASTLDTLITTTTTTGLTTPVPTTANGVNISGCPDSAIPLNYIHDSVSTFCYRIEQTGVVLRDEAVQICGSEGGHLATFTNEESYESVTDGLVFDAVTVKYWIDGTDLDFDGNWRTHDGAALNWFRWTAQNPKGGLGCVIVGPHGTKMEDMICDDPEVGGYICQIDT